MRASIPRAPLAPRATRWWLAVAVLAAGLPLPAFATQQLVVVRKTGHATSHVSQAKIGAAAMAVCADASVAFAFIAEPREGSTLELDRSVDASRDIIIDVTLTCATLRGTALIPFDASGGNAVRGIDYISTPGVALLDLTAAADNPGASAPVAAPVRIDVLDNPQAGSTPVTFSIVRREGSFQGMSADGTPVVGAIPGNNEALVAVTILGRVTIRDAAEIVPGIDPAASEISAATTAFCRPGGGGAGQVGCAETQRAADIVANPLTPAAEREAATIVLENNLLAIAPDETTALAFVAPRMASVQRDNLAQRLVAMRSADQGGTLSTDGLSMISNGLPVSLSGLPKLLHIGDEESAQNEERRTLLGGTRLGLWVNGTLGGSERDRRSANSGFESDSWDVTSGLDYRFSDRWFAGVALGFSHLDLDFDDDQGALDVDARSLHGYAGYSLPSGLSFDGSMNFMRSDFKQRRTIELFELDPGGSSYSSLGRDVARGQTDVDQFGGSLGVTWTIMREAWTIAPQAQISLLRTEYDAFEESGPSAFNLGYRERSSNSTSFSVGSYVDRTFATTVGAFRPYARAFYFSDSGSSKDLLADFVLAGASGSNTPVQLSMNEPDRRYGSAEIGLGFSRPIGTRTVDFNAGYMQMFSFADYDRWALRFDIRIPL